MNAFSKDARVIWSDLDVANAEIRRLRHVEEVQHRTISNWTARGLRLEQEVRHFEKEVARLRDEVRTLEDDVNRLRQQLENPCKGCGQ